MFTTKSGEKIFVVDGHVHLWDGSDENCKNRYGEEFIKCFYDYHKLSPKEYVWPYQKYQKYTDEDFEQDVFANGYVDVAIFNPQHLGDFYHHGFSSPDRNDAFKKKHPDRVITNGFWDPRNEEAGLKQLERDAEKYGWRGIKLYTAEWKGDSKGWKLTDPWSYRYLEKSQELGLKNIHVHKGPTIRPLNKDAFDVADVDEVASLFPELNFIVEHCGLPRLSDFTFIAAQEPNVYAGLAVAIALIHTRPRYFSEIISELLFWLGPDRILFGSDYALWQPKWIIDKFMDLELPDDLAAETGPLTLEMKKKILGENAARLYNIEIAEPEKRFGQPISEKADAVGTAAPVG
ncbi:MAG TPA: amidohydrolase family protein [Chthoniobacterales bacterium]|nr:amidohydrolase family protein [Chthoniobacterales bacterium]